MKNSHEISSQNTEMTDSIVQGLASSTFTWMIAHELYNKR